MCAFSRSPQTYVRIAGICYLLIILLGVFGQVVVRNSLIVAGDAAATVANISESLWLWRLGIIGDIAMHILDIPLMIILYLLLRPIHQIIALLALVLNIIQTAVLAVNKLTLIIPLILIGDTGYVLPDQINAQIMLLINVHNYGFGLGLIFFGFACIAYGYLIFASKYFPGVIGIFMVAAGMCYLVNSLVLILIPSISPFVFPLLGVCLLAELSLSLWLLLKGVSLPHWRHALQKLES